MAPAQIRAYARAHARLEHSSRASWMEDARAAIWIREPSDFKACTDALRRGE